MKALLLLAGLFSLPIMAEAAPPPPPTSIVVIACRVDDLTGQPGRQDPGFAARGWRDLEWHFTQPGNELECKREQIELTDAVTLMAPEVNDLKPNFSDFAQCAAVAMQYGPQYDKTHPGWATLAVGCPVRIETDGILTGWKLPDCPREIAGLPITCRFDGSLI